MIKAKRLRHATFVTPDLAGHVDYYRSVIGLGEIARGARHAVLGTTSDQLVLVLEAGNAPACRQVAFEVAPDIDLAETQTRLQAAGLATQLRSDHLPGIALSLTLRDPEGTEIELIPGWTPTPSPQQPAGLAVDKLGHLAFATADPQAIAKFYGDVLGFRVSDWIEQSFVFMRCGADHHTLNFARADARRLHHIAFELRDASHMHRACDLLGRERRPILWGPVRHGPGHNVAVYHRNPDGHLVELFFDLDRIVDEDLGYFEPRPWHRDRPQRPKTWGGSPRDVWGLPPSPDLAEFARKTP